MRFHNHKIIYLSLGVNEISSDIFNQICGRFGGFIDYDDELETGSQKIERQKLPEDVSAETITETITPLEDKKQEQQEIRQILKLNTKVNLRMLLMKTESIAGNQGDRARRHHEKAEHSKDDADRGQRHERKETSCPESKNHNRSRGERNGQKRFEKKALDKQEKAASNEKQA